MSPLIKTNSATDRGTPGDPIVVFHYPFRATKAPRLPRPWPLLAQGQDPASLEARVAFHLHRLKLVGRALHHAGYDRNAAADLSAARTLLAPPELYALIARLGVDAVEISRPLTPEESRRWAFYRASASSPREVWLAARAAWRARGLTNQQAAEIMGIDRPALSRALASPQRRTLSFEAAMRLTTALSMPQGPEALLPLPDRDTENPSR